MVKVCNRHTPHIYTYILFSKYICSYAFKNIIISSVSITVMHHLWSRVASNELISTLIQMNTKKVKYCFFIIYSLLLNPKFAQSEIHAIFLNGMIHYFRFMFRVYAMNRLQKSLLRNFHRNINATQKNFR